MYSRADLSRTAALVVALSLTAAATGALAREFRAADTQNEDDPAVRALRYAGGLTAERTGGRHRIRAFHSHQLGEEKETVRALGAAGVIIVRDLDRKPFEAAMATICEKARRDPAAAQLIERIRKVA